MRWFKHDADANADAKLQNVLLDYGLEGYGLYWYCIELIAGKVDVDNLTFQLEHDARIIARNTGSTPQKVEEMMKYFVKIGLFECSENVISCFKMAKRLDKSMTSNPMMREMIDKIKSDSHDVVMMIPDSVMQDKTRLDKNINTHISPGGDCKKGHARKRKASIDYESIMDGYNKVSNGRLPSAEKITPKRKRAIDKLLSELKEPTVECAVNYFDAFFSNARPFYFGDNDRQWKADLDYVLRVETMIKTKEGSL